MKTLLLPQRFRAPEREVSNDIRRSLRARRRSAKGGEGDAGQNQVRVERKGRTDAQGLEGAQGSLEAQAGRRRQDYGEEAYRQGLG